MMFLQGQSDSIGCWSARRAADFWPRLDASSETASPRLIFCEGFHSDDRRLDMKLIFLLTSATVMLASEAFAQNAPPRAATIAPPRPGAVPALDASGLPAGEEARFDLKFPGGPVKEFVAAVNK